MIQGVVVGRLQVARVGTLKNVVVVDYGFKFRERNQRGTLYSVGRLSSEDYQHLRVNRRVEQTMPYWSGE